MSFFDKLLKRNTEGESVPQYFNKKANDYEVVEGDNGSFNVQLTGSFTRLSTEPKPTIYDGVKDGNDLLLVDTKQVFVFYKGEWREI